MEKTASTPIQLFRGMTADELAALRKVLSLDPRPHYQDNPEKVYGMMYAGKDVKFRVEGDVLTVVEVE